MAPRRSPVAGGQQARILKVGDIEIVEPSELRLVQAALRSALGHTGIALAGEWLGRRGLRFRMVAPGASQAVADIPYNVVELVVENDRVYWAGAELQFRWENADLRFHSMSLLFFSGVLNQEPKAPVIRAEWECAPDPPGPHAQPHWHVYLATVATPPRFVHHFWDPSGNVIGRVMDEAARPDEEDEARVASQDQGALMRFHLAMGARWHAAHAARDDRHYEGPTGEGVARWIEGCVAYTRTQLQYVAKKLRALEELPPASSQPKLPF
jgi:hypothetical protein